MSITFKQHHSFERRVLEAARIKQLHPDRIPIVCEKAKNQIALPIMDKVKYLVPYDITVSQFLTVVRKRLSLKPEVALMLSVENGIVPSSIASIGSLHEEYRDADGFLYIEYYQENTFGYDAN